MTHFNLRMMLKIFTMQYAFCIINYKIYGGYSLIVGRVPVKDSATGQNRLATPLVPQTKNSIIIRLF
jgi:hypothetical protein